jgi:hypothetical protein
MEVRSMKSRLAARARAMLSLAVVIAIALAVEAGQRWR